MDQETEPVLFEEAIVELENRGKINQGSAESGWHTLIKLPAVIYRPRSGKIPKIWESVHYLMYLGFAGPFARDVFDIVKSDYRDDQDGVTATRLKSQAIRMMRNIYDPRVLAMTEDQFGTAHALDLLSIEQPVVNEIINIKRAVNTDRAALDPLSSMTLGPIDGLTLCDYIVDALTIRHIRLERLQNNILTLSNWP